MINTPMHNPDWWRGAVIYQIYPRSFMDSNGDGIGDLKGITSKLDYIASLGVDAIWISPFFQSPMADFGYDVSDYRAVDPLFGTLDDFDELLKCAHQLDLKVIIDQVISHTSDQHPWFQQSRQDRHNEKADWYVWADPKPDGAPPNNWLAIFGGNAWHWEPRRQQYYLHNFLVSQPDLNFHNENVQRQLIKEMEFWLQRGVDGFRLDTVNFYFHDKLLRDNPPRPASARVAQGFSADNPYAYQYHQYDKTQPENHAFLRRLRALLDRFPGSTSIGEIGDDNALHTMAEYTSGNDKLHMAYSFELLGPNSSAKHIRHTISSLENQLGDGWPCWALSNHDVIRVLSRWEKHHSSPEYAKVLLALLFSLRGSVCLYQGEELGLEQADIAYEDLQDPFGLAFWPEFKGRDGCRTPMPWHNDQTIAGFSTATPWLPIPEQHRLSAVSVQDTTPQSVLNLCRTFLRWRQRQPALRLGQLIVHDSPGETLVLSRLHKEQSLLACFNLSETPIIMILPEEYQQRIIALTDCGFSAELDQHQHKVNLPAFGAFFGQIQSDTHHG